MTKIALLTDTHFGVRNDNNIFYDYFDKFYDKVFFPTLKKEGVTDVIHLGDFVDRRKYINFVTLNHMSKIVKRIVKDHDLYCIVGNHDIPYKNTNYINAMSELYDIENLYVMPDSGTYEFDGVPICFIPWINDENREATFKEIKETKAQIALGHLEVAGFSMYRDSILAHGLDPKVFEKFEMVCTGHFHHKSNKENIRYLGSPYETNWSDYNDERGFHILDTETRELKFIRNPYRLFHKIIYNDTEKDYNDINNLEYINGTYLKIIIQKKDDLEMFDKFIDKIYSYDPIDVDIVEDNKKLNEMTDFEISEQSEDTLTVLNNYVDKNIETGKDDLKHLFISLYNEALTMEV